MQFTCSCPATAELKDACGLPLGLVVQPLAAPDGSGGGVQPPACWAADVARCSRCLAYINPLCGVDDEGWACALCGCANDFSTATSMRRYYGASAEWLGILPELRHPALDAACPLVPADPDEGTQEVEAVEAAPTVLALVDACWEEEGALDAVKSALTAAVEALPPVGRFGLVSFGSQIALHQVSPNGDVSDRLVLHEPAAEAEESPLENVAPLGSVLAPVCTCKTAMLAAIEGLEAEPPAGGGRERALGDTLRAVLRWVATGAAAASADGFVQQQAAAAAPQQQEEPGREDSGSEEGFGTTTGSLLPAQGFPGLRLLLFLSGPPNVGAGAVVARKPAPIDPKEVKVAAEAAAADAAKNFAGLVLDPAYVELTAWGDAAAASVEAAAAKAAARAKAAADAAAAAGDLSHATPPGVAEADLVIQEEARDFWVEVGAAAAALGISVDIFAACAGWIGLKLLEPLATKSGGSLLLYSSLEAAPLPQDVYKSVTQPRAFACVLRLRCSPELRLASYYGRLTADREPGLFRLVACGPEDAFAFEMDRTEQYSSGAAPAVQLVLQYSMLLPASPAAGEEQEGGSGGTRFVLCRRMRILTAAVQMASTPQQLYEHCDAEVTTCLVVHKALEVAAARGAAAARQMLLDWLAGLAARVADPDALLWHRRRGETPPPVEVDASLSTVEALQQLPHVVYALLRGPLLQATPVAPDPTLFRMASSAGAHWHAHPEAAAALQALLQVLPPDEATVAVCPQLSSWASPDEVAVWRHSLSAAALAVEQQPIWCLDTFQHLIVLYSATDFGLVGGPPPPIFPPPAGSLLRRTLAGIRQVRRSTPELLLLRQGIDDISFFNSFLLEDAPSLPPAPAMGPFGGDASTAGPAAATEQRQLHPPSFVSFLESVAVAAQEMLRTGQ